LPQPEHTKLFDAELVPTSPPATLPAAACTLPPAVDDKIVPELLPTKPPTRKLATLRLPTFPIAEDPEIKP